MIKMMEEKINKMTMEERRKMEEEEKFVTEHESTVKALNYSHF